MEKTQLNLSQDWLTAADAFEKTMNDLDLTNESDRTLLTIAAFQVFSTAYWAGMQRVFES
jgi:hypothetical protein